MLTGLLMTQAGKEGTWGTAVVDTVKLMGVTNVEWDGGIKSTRIMDEMRGSLAPAYNIYVEAIMPTIKVDGYVCAEDMGYFFDSIFTEATGVLASSAYVYSWAASLAAVQAAPRMMTMFFGDAPGTKVYKATGCIFNKISIKIEKDKPWTYSAEGFAKQIVSGASFASLADRTITLATTNGSSVAVTAAAGTIGAGTFTATAFSADLTFENGRTPDMYIGALTAQSHHEGKWDGSIKLSAEYNATSASLIEDQYTASPAVQSRLIRLLYTNGGATSALRKVQVDMGVTAEEAPKLWTDINGLVGFEWEGKGTYDTGAFANWLKASVTNASVTLA